MSKDLHAIGMTLTLMGMSKLSPEDDDDGSGGFPLFRSRRKWWFVAVLSCPNGHVAYASWPHGHVEHMQCRQCGAWGPVLPIEDHQQALEQGYLDENNDV